MADLLMYEDFELKKEFFSNGKESSFVIDTKDELDNLLKHIKDKDQESKSATSFIYRGMTEAKYKIYTSAQRLWLTNEMAQWTGKPYLEFIYSLIQTAKDNKLIETVFELYNYNNKERDFPILSLLQHCGVPTPLIDWTYSHDVAFFFGTDGIKKKERPWKSTIDDYFAIYCINKRNYSNEILNLQDSPYKIDSIPSFQSYIGFGDDQADRSSNTVFYLSDFEKKGESTGESQGSPKLCIQSDKPLTSVYNQNILPQKGMFIFNPYAQKPLEEIFNPSPESPNSHIYPFDCFNIHKDLSEYLRRKIDVRYGINTKFIYPKLNDVAEAIKEDAIKGLIPNNDN